MATAPVNNPPAPVQEMVNVALPSPADCAKIKDEFGIQTGSHGSLKGKHPAKSQRHHVFQWANSRGLAGYSAAIAVVLVGGSHAPGSEHAMANDMQKARAKAGAATTFGQLKSEAEKDLYNALLVGNRKSKTTKKKMTKRQAAQIAKCVVAEAEKKAKKEVAKRGDAPPTNSSTDGITTPGGCFAPGTLVWLVGRGLVAVEDVRAGDWIQTPAGPERVVRVDGCEHDLVEIDLGDDVLTIASFHRVLLADGTPRRADGLRAGDTVRTVGGARVVAAARSLGRQLQPVHRIGCDEHAVCAIGQAGVWMVLPEAGPHIDREESVVPFFAEEAQPCPS